ncbi:transketolase [Candidatus Dependentiae bacterium]|nr:MAG: transketolase [Candidatus Dependentiae bacterium]
MAHNNSVAHYAYLLRKLSLLMSVKAGSGHPTSCFSCADIVAMLFFHELIFDINNFESLSNDRFILSKGHASALLYAVWHLLGKMSYEELLTYRTFYSVLEGHPTRRFAYAEAATGSLGNGLGIAVGQALYAKRMQLPGFIYVLLGDGELFEGANWEAMALASYYGLDNLVAIIDCNRLGQSCPTMFEHHIDQYQQKFLAFGFTVQIVDGHNVQELAHVFANVKNHTKKPHVIIAKTYKGHGISEVENKEGFHGKPLADKNYALAFNDEMKVAKNNEHIIAKLPQKRLPEITSNKNGDLKGIALPLYAVGDTVSTRYGFGQGLVALGANASNCMVLDADVQNSTFTEFFAKAFPERFVQCFIGEQTLVNVAVGLERHGAVPFLATFGAFLSRAHDQIRMAAIGNVPLRICGSHAGVSIGQDGPSQMALEDIAFMRCLPDSVVLYPADAVCSFKLVQHMYAYTKGISYMRTTRADMPVLYNSSQDFGIGKAIVLQKHAQDTACIIAAGITVFEALKALAILKEQYHKTVAIIDLYSIKPFDKDTVVELTQHAGGNMIVVEDHYYEGGIGEMITAACTEFSFTIVSLAVKTLPRSGAKDELLQWAEIDAQAIVQAVLRL